MENNINILRTRRMILEYKFLTTELEEVSLQSKEYVTKFLDDLIPDDINIFDNDEKENPEEEKKTEEEIELDEISSEILNKLHKISLNSIKFTKHHENPLNFEKNLIQCQHLKLEFQKHLIAQCYSHLYKAYTWQAFFEKFQF